MSYDIRVTKAGINADTATSPNDFIFHSSYNTLKQLAKAIYSPTLSDTGGAESSATVSHGSSDIPFAIAFCKFTTGRLGGAGSIDNNNDFRFTRLVVDGTNVTLYYVNDTGGNYTPSFVIYLYEIPL